MNGTLSTGCPLHGGPGDVASMKAVIDWLNGRAPGYDKDGNPVTAPWHNGKAAMSGKSYDGTPANGVAATGVDGLTTIVSISAIPQWYGYSRAGGIRHNTNYPSFPARAVTNDDRRALCTASRTWLDDDDGDEHGDIHQFWLDRDHLKDADKVKASVFITHGRQDDNGRFDQATSWWDAPEERKVPRKMWLIRTGHEDRFDFRRAEWVDTLHRWFDHWLHGIDSGIMEEPRVDIEVAKDTWEIAPDGPIPSTQEIDVYSHGTATGAAGRLGLGSGGATDALSWTDAAQNESTIIGDPTGSQANRLVFLSAPLRKPLRISGTPVLDVQASLSTTQSNVGAVLVDYGHSTQITRSSDGIIDASPVVRTCWGESSAYHSACYKEVQKPTVDLTQWRVSKGILDSSNRGVAAGRRRHAGGDRQSVPVRVGDVPERLRVRRRPPDRDHPGRQLHELSSVAGATGSTVMLDTRVSEVRLPIVGGYGVAVASGGFAGS